MNRHSSNFRHCSCLLELIELEFKTTYSMSYLLENDLDAIKSRISFV